MIVIATLVCIVGALAYVIVHGAIALRRKNREIDRLRRQRPITDKRWRALNVIDRCDFSAGCHARSHETGCVRGRIVGPSINVQLDQLPKGTEDDNDR